MIPILKTLPSQVWLPIRGVAAGTLMGLANLVPGVSGGTMLLAMGVYQDFISAVAEASTLRFRRRSLILLGSVVGAAGLAILLLAGLVRSLVIDHRWVMYSLFIGLTLGGIPLVWRLIKPGSAAVFFAAAVAFALMLLMALGSDPSNGGGAATRNYVILAFAGLAGASAMILPGVSGGYLVLLLGQYETILGAVDQVKDGILGDAAAGIDPSLALVMSAMHVVVPVGLGVLAGVVGVSNLLRWLLHRFTGPTLGGLLGLLCGAVAGLWPFQRSVGPAVDGTRQALEIFSPNIWQILSALALIGAGLTVTWSIDWLGRGGRSNNAGLAVGQGTG